MAFSSIYRLTFNDSKGYRIQCDIQKDNYGGSVTDLTMDGDAPIVIVDSLKGTIMTKGCKLNLINDLTDLFEYAKIHIEDEKTYRLSIIQSEAGLNQIQLFMGYLIDDVFHQKLQKNEPIVLAFNNGLAHLDRYYPAFLEGADVYVSEQEIIEQCLAFANPEANIYVNNTLYEDNMSSDDLLDSPFLATYLNKRAFTKDDGDFENADEILIKILNSVNAIVYEKEGHFYIERNIDRDITDKTWWRYTPANSNAYDSVAENGIVPTDLNPEILKRRALKYSIIPAARLIKLQLIYDKFNNMIINYWSNIINTSSFLPGNDMDRWHYNGTYMVVDTLAFSNDFMFHGWRFHRDTYYTEEEFTNNAQMAYHTMFTKHPEDETVLSFSFKQWAARSPYSYLKFRFYIHLQDSSLVRYAYWDDVTETWSLEIAPGEINVYTNSEERIQSEWNCSLDIDLTGLLLSWDDHIHVKIVVRVTIDETDVGLPPFPISPGMGGAYGDFELKTNVEDPDNLWTADLNIAKNKVIEKKIKLFDTLSWNYENSKYILDGTNYQISESWTDETITSLTLQRHLITNWGNYYNQPRSTFNLVLIKKLIQANELFETSLLQDENSDDIKLYIEQMTHDVKQNSFSIKFVEYIADIGKRIGLNP